MAISEIIKTDSIITAVPGDTVAMVMMKLHTSHDAAFVFDNNKMFKGIVNPYYCMIKSSLPGNAKIEGCIFHPPRIEMDTPTSKVAQNMIDCKVHYLPVFHHDMFKGIISARRLLAKKQHSPKLAITVGEILRRKRKSLTTIREDEFVSKALAVFKSEKVSKIVVVSEEGKLRGILTYYDIILFLVEPRKRSQKEGTTTLGHQLVKHFMKSLVLTLPEEAQITDALKLIIDKQIGSVVIVDSQKKPVGIVTTSDFLQLLKQEGSGTPVDITTKNISPQNRSPVRHFFHRVTERIQKFRDISRARVLVKEEKQGNLFQVVLSLFPRRGKPTVIKKEGRDLNEVLRQVKEKDKRVLS